MATLKENVTYPLATSNSTIPNKTAGHGWAVSSMCPFSPGVWLVTATLTLTAKAGVTELGARFTGFSDTIQTPVRSKPATPGESIILTLTEIITIPQVGHVGAQTHCPGGQMQIEGDIQAVRIG